MYDLESIDEIRSDLLAFGDLLNKDTNWTWNHACRFAEIVGKLTRLRGSAPDPGPEEAASLLQGSVRANDEPRFKILQGKGRRAMYELLCWLDIELQKADTLADELETERTAVARLISNWADELIDPEFCRLKVAQEMKLWLDAVGPEEMKLCGGTGGV